MLWIEPWGGLFILSVYGTKILETDVYLFDLHCTLYTYMALKKEKSS